MKSKFLLMLLVAAVVAIPLLAVAQSDVLTLQRIIESLRRQISLLQGTLQTAQSASSLVNSGEGATATSSPRVTLSNPSLLAINRNPEYLGDVRVAFSLTSNGGTVYTSKNPALALDLDTTARSIVSTAVVANVCGSCGDTSRYFVIPDGVTRNFTYIGLVENKDGIVTATSTATTSAHRVSVRRIFYGDDMTTVDDYVLNARNLLRAQVYLDTVDLP